MSASVFLFFFFSGEVNGCIRGGGGRWRGETGGRFVTRGEEKRGERRGASPGC